jgi:hypothetical protein
MAKRKRETSGSKAATPLDDYKAFVDALIRIRPDVSASWVTKKRSWPDLPENRATNTFVGKLTDAEREVLAILLQHARDGGIHDVLAYLADEINLKGLRLVREGRELPVEPFGTELHYDWTCRRDGDSWPQSDP